MQNYFLKKFKDKMCSVSGDWSRNEFVNCGIEAAVMQSLHPTVSQLSIRKLSWKTGASGQ